MAVQYNVWVESEQEGVFWEHLLGAPGLIEAERLDEVDA